MSKLSNPTLFSDAFRIKPKALRALGVLDPILNIDTRLFIDPLLLEVSSHKEISEGARGRYTAHFGKVVKLLRASKKVDDVAWRAARGLLQFREIRGTCLGYGAGTIRGTGFGARLTEDVLSTAKEIVDLGIDDPDFFALLALFEEGIGPDRISDMVTNIILPDLVAFNARVLSVLHVPSESFEVGGKIVKLAKNPCESPAGPVIIVPQDILKPLPIAVDWAEVSSCAAQNASLRQRVNTDVGAIWQAKTAKEKAEFRDIAFSSKQAAMSVLDTIKKVEKAAYDLAGDPKGFLRWLSAAREFAERNPLVLARPAALTINEVEKLVDSIVDQFQLLVEEKGLAKELWFKGKLRGEKAVQRLFFAVADTYCKANNLDVTPEADSGAGPVDFKFASTYDCRVLVELKLSSNSKLVHGFTTQLEAYKDAEETTRAIYLVVDVGDLDDKDAKLVAVANQRRAKGLPVSKLVFVDGTVKASASTR